MARWNPVEHPVPAATEGEEANGDFVMQTTPGPCHEGVVYGPRTMASEKLAVVRDRAGASLGLWAD